MKIIIEVLPSKIDYKEEYKNKIMELPDETIEIIGLELFDMKEVKEIEKYL